MKQEIQQLTQKAEHYFGSSTNDFARCKLANGIVQMILDNHYYISQAQKRNLLKDLGYVKRAELARKLGMSKQGLSQKIEREAELFNHVQFGKTLYYKS